jgi:hypothetical protein
MSEEVEYLFAQRKQNRQLEFWQARSALTPNVHVVEAVTRDASSTIGRSHHETSQRCKFGFSCKFVLSG